MRTMLKATALLLLAWALTGCGQASGPPQNGHINGVPVVCRWLEFATFDFSCKIRLAGRDDSPPPRFDPTPIEGECE